MRVSSKDIARLVKESVQKILKESEGGHTPSVYVGTYRKYNNGSLFGEWVDLDKFENRDEFYAYIRKLHKDERDPEFMFQDWEYVPSCFIGESWISPLFWDFLNDDSGYDYDVKCAVAENSSDPKEYFKQIKDIAVYPDCSDMSDVVYAWVKENGFPSSASNYFDYEEFGRDCTFDWSEDEEGQSIYEAYGVTEGDDYALGEEIVAQTYGDVEKMPREEVERYFDYDAYGRDWSLESTFIDYDGGMIELY